MKKKNGGHAPGPKWSLKTHKRARKKTVDGRQRGDRPEVKRNLPSFSVGTFGSGLTQTTQGLEKPHVRKTTHGGTGGMRGIVSDKRKKKRSGS